MPAHTCVRARAPPLAAAGRPAPVPVPGSGSGSGLGLGSGSLPGLVLFESGLKGMGSSATRTKPAPLRIRTARQRMSANGSEPPANGCLKTVCAVGRTRMPLPERYK